MHGSRFADRREEPGPLTFLPAELGVTLRDLARVEALSLRGAVTGEANG
jgi:hypothetical protein